MRVQFEAEQAQQRKGTLDFLGTGGSMVRGKHGRIKALDAHLDFRAAEAARTRERLRRDGVGTRFNDQAHATVLGGFVYALLLFKLAGSRGLPRCQALPRAVLPVERTVRLVECGCACVDCRLSGCGEGSQGFLGFGNARALVAFAQFSCVFRGAFAIVERAKQLRHVPVLVVLGVVGPGAAQHNKLHFIGGVTHLAQCMQARSDLEIWVEKVALGALTGGFVRQVALRHANVVGAVDAVA